MIDPIDTAAALDATTGESADLINIYPNIKPRGNRASDGRLQYSAGWDDYSSLSPEQRRRCHRRVLQDSQGDEGLVREFARGWLGALEAARKEATQRALEGDDD